MIQKLGATHNINILCLGNNTTQTHYKKYIMQLLTLTGTSKRRVS